MSHKHRKTLHAVFSHPIPSNIHLHEVEAALKDLGGEFGHSSHGRLTVSMNGHTASFHGSDHGLSKDEVVSVRKFLESCGFTADAFPA